MSDLRSRIADLIKSKEERRVCDLSDIADMLEENDQLKARVAELEKLHSEQRDIAAEKAREVIELEKELREMTKLYKMKLQ